MGKNVSEGVRFEWRNWILTNVDTVCFDVLFKRLKELIYEIENTKPLEKRKAFLQEEIDYLESLSSRVYSILLSLHKEHGIRFEVLNIDSSFRQRSDLLRMKPTTGLFQYLIQ